jgi:glycosyltransferase involved in cell wall biosynthesis
VAPYGSTRGCRQGRNTWCRSFTRRDGLSESERAPGTGTDVGDTGDVGDGADHRDGAEHGDVGGHGASAARPVAIVNHWNETFTPTHSGAIATWIWETCRAAEHQGERPWVVTRRGAHTPYPWSCTSLVPALPSPVQTLSRRWHRAERAVARIRRTTSLDQWYFARRAGERVQQLVPRAAVCHNDPDLAVVFRRASPRLPVVHWFHNLDLATDAVRRRYRSIQEHITTVAVSRYLARAVERAYGLVPQSVLVVPNGIDSDRFRPGTDVREHPVIGFVGRVGREKAPDLLLESCIILAQRLGPVFEVQVVGASHWGWSEGTPFERRVDELGEKLVSLGVRFRRTGHVDREKLPEVLRGTDIHVVPSRWDEPFGLTLLEGMASGAAPLAAACGGLPEVAGDPGWLFVREDPVALADALAPLVSDPQRRARSARLARERSLVFPWSATWQGVQEAVMASTAAVAGTRRGVPVGEARDG